MSNSTNYFDLSNVAKVLIFCKLHRCNVCFFVHKFTIFSKLYASFSPAGFEKFYKPMHKGSHFEKEWGNTVIVDVVN